ncbi:MAG TPA: flagellar basal body-associated FliL family protein [Stellaceae bacterium]
MSDQALSNDLDVPATPAQAKAKRLSGKKLVFFVIAPLVLLLAAGGGLYATGILGKLLGHGGGAAEEGAKGDEATGHGAAGDREAAGKPAAFFDLPDLLVNLNASGRRTSFLKISVSLEVASAADVPKLQAVLPRIVDSFQVYLRELRVEDLKGSAGMYRLREELMVRVNAAAAPVKINDVLFKEMLIQ